jgi:mannose/fructose-specific phosphotransferase system component IIA
MSQYPHDEFAKGLLESLPALFGKVEAAYTLSSETREIDVYDTQTFQNGYHCDP